MKFPIRRTVRGVFCFSFFFILEEEDGFDDEESAILSKELLGDECVTEGGKSRRSSGREYEVDDGKDPLDVMGEILVNASTGLTRWVSSATPTTSNGIWNRDSGILSDETKDESRLSQGRSEGGSSQYYDNTMMIIMVSSRPLHRFDGAR
jgi:hypothetical protein